MGHYEDFFWEIHEELKQLGLRKEFDKKLKENNTKVKIKK